MSIPVTYLRSSSYSAWDFCPHRYYLEYALSVPSISNKKADLGTITHKAIEILARAKKARQQSQEEFTEEETGNRLGTNVSPDIAVEKAWNHYTAKWEHHEWSSKDRDFVLDSTNKALEITNGRFNPANRHVVDCEKFFDIELTDKKFAYDHMIDGHHLKGFLRLRGTVDLIYSAGENLLEVVDWKTGRCWDWARDKPKDYMSFLKDFQLSFYHYALSRVYPGKQIIITIVYINDGGPFTVAFDEKSNQRTEQLIHQRMKEVESTKSPKRIWGNWKCKSFCHYGKNRHEESGELLCEHYHQELQQLGIERVTKKHLDPNKFGQYEGGGRSERASAGV